MTPAHSAQTSKRAANIFFFRGCFDAKPTPARINPGMGSHKEANRASPGLCGTFDAVPGGFIATTVNVVVEGVAPSVTDEGENEHCARAGETAQENVTGVLRAPFCELTVMVSSTLLPDATLRVGARLKVKSAGRLKVAVTD